MLHVPRSRALVVGALVLLLAGCGGGSDPEPASDPGGTEARTSQSGWPILVIEHVGGLRPAGQTGGPLLAAYVAGDGRLIVPGPEIAIFPAPALPNLRQRQLSPAGLEALRNLATEARLGARPPDYGQPNVADATTTVVTYQGADGRTFVHRAYALGAGGGGLSEAERERRRRLARFVGAVTDPEATFDAGAAGPDEAFVARAFEVTAMPPPDTPPEVEPTTQAWPVESVRLEQAERCTPVTGPDAELLREALRDANELTRWRDGGQLFVLGATPVLPGAPPCV